MACGTGGGCNGCSVSEKRGCGTSSVFNWQKKLMMQKVIHILI